MTAIATYMIMLSGLLIGLALPEIILKLGIQKKHLFLVLILLTVVMYMAMSSYTLFTQGFAPGIQFTKTPFLGFLALFFAGGMAVSLIVNKK